MIYLVGLGLVGLFWLCGADEIKYFILVQDIN